MIECVMRNVMYVTSLFAVLLIFTTGATTAIEGDIECGAAMACFPWMGEDGYLPCLRGRRMNLRFMLDLAPENVNPAEPANTIAVYGFCPVVDRLQIFTLTHAPFLASVYDNGGTLSLTHSIERKYLSVFGFGMSNNTKYPQKNISAGAVLIGVNGSTLCGSYRSVALVNTLLLDIGLHKGRFNYIGAKEASVPPSTGSSSSSDDNNNNNTLIPEVVVQPAMVGFRPTCNENDECLLDSNSVCVGTEVGKKNCATCYNDPEDIRDNARLRVWTSYYGTDTKGRPLLSGGMNPLNFRGFAGSGFFKDIAQTLNDIKGGDVNNIAQIMSDIKARTINNVAQTLDDIKTGTIDSITKTMNDVKTETINTIAQTVNDVMGGNVSIGM